jgi:hypothetical protein
MRITKEERELSLFAIRELQEETKKDLVRDYIHRFYDDTGRFPEREDIQETYDHIYLDDTLVNNQLEMLRGVLK